MLRPCFDEVLLRLNEIGGRGGEKGLWVSGGSGLPLVGESLGNSLALGAGEDALGAAAFRDHLVEERLGRGDAHEDVGQFGSG